MKTVINTFSKNLQFTDGNGQTVFVEIRIEDGRLSMCGNMAGSGGQIVDQIKPANQPQKDLIEIWQMWHLNDMHAGTPEQENALNSEEFEIFCKRFEAEGRAQKEEVNLDFSHYTMARQYLNSKGLYIVDYNGERYAYGSAWLTRELPGNIIERLENICALIGGEFTGSPYEKQANDILTGMGVKFSAKFKDHAKYFHDDKEARDIYTVQFRRGRNAFSITFGQSIANQGTPPTAYDVLACLTKSDPGTFEDFCYEMGYDTDSKRAEKTHSAVWAEWTKVNAFFTDDEIEQLQEIN